MVKVEVDNFDVKQIAQSGQCFRMNEIGPGGPGGDLPLR